MLFKAKVLAEGSKKANLRVTIPYRVAKTLPTPGWLRFTPTGPTSETDPFYGFARRPPSRSSSATVTLPPWRFPEAKIGDEIEFEIEDAAPYRATQIASDPDQIAFDWLPFVDGDERYFVTESEGVLHIHSRHAETFRLIRFPNEAAVYWLLGFYQAEGSKSDIAFDWTLANINVGLLNKTVESLCSLGVARERQYIEVLWPKDRDTEKDAREFFESLKLHVGASRSFKAHPTHPRSNRQAVLHVRNSLLFLRMTKKVLDKIFKEGFPTKLAAGKFAMGWLDGDGTITAISGPGRIELRLAGLEDEHRVVQEALHQTFGWQVKGSGYIDNKQGTRISLRVFEMMQLLDAGAFKFSMSRARLLLAFSERAEPLAEIARGKPPYGAFALWGLVDADGVLTDSARAVCAGAKRMATEINEAKQRLATTPKGKKGMPW